jgi:hypothetical protein
MDREAGPLNQDREAGPLNQARSGPGPGRRGTELNPRSKENDICESAVLNHRAINATNCDVTGSVILSDRYRGVTVPSCEIKRRGFSGTKGFCSR